MQQWYIYRDGKLIKLAFLDQAGALHLHNKGYELGRAHSTKGRR